MTSELRRARDRARKIRGMVTTLVGDPLSMPPAFAYALKQWTGELISDLRADVDEPNVCDHCDAPAPPDHYLCSPECKNCQQAGMEQGKPCVGLCGKTTTRHPDGSICLEGTQRVPEDFRACCRTFLDHTKSCAFDVRYEWTEQHGWMIAIDGSAGGGGIQITTCPHCGVTLWA